MTEYHKFLASKRQLGGDHGFMAQWMPENLFDFQRELVAWSVRRGRAAIFADCGLGKTAVQLTWAKNVVLKTNRPVLILTPLAVGPQTVKEGEKFGVECEVSRDGKIPGCKIAIANYERLHYFDSADFSGLVCDESSILKNFDGATKAAVTEFARTLPYRLLCTATAAPNDYIELGTSSEALGELGFIDMIGRFFKKIQGTSSRSEEFRHNVWRFRGHAEKDFWRWVCSWSRALRKPSDLGFDDGAFVLPELKQIQHTVKARTIRPGYLFDLPAIGLKEQREERRRTINERCEMAAKLATTDDPVVAWCHLNDEGDLLEKLIPDAVQVSGKDSTDKKEEILIAFGNAEIRALVTKPKIAGFGLNWQHCNHQTYFPSHSFEQYYQGVRRIWRFGQDRAVTIDVVASEGDADIMANMERKQIISDAIFSRIIEMVGRELNIKHKPFTGAKEEVPAWLSSTKQ
jgi:hypothetical protein